MENRKAAMEMSVGTIVTIVLLMTVLILGLTLVRSIFSSGTDAIDSIDAAVQNEINKLFAEEGKKLVVFPTSRQISLKKGDDPAGFGFAVKNVGQGTGSDTFTYQITADAEEVQERCGISGDEAESYLLPSQGQFNLARGESLEPYELILFTLPEDAPICTMTYRLEVSSTEQPSYASSQIFVTVE
jgi:hypothetical protein